MSPTELSRRVLVAGVASVASAVAAPAIAAIQSSDTADPIFAALERWQKIEIECHRLLDEESDGGINQSPRAAAAVEAIWEERLRLAETAPTTLAGLAAYVRFLHHQSAVVLETSFFESEGEHDEQLAFFESLDRSVASIAAAHGVIQ